MIDMRGSAWAAIKPILKVLQEHFPSSVHQALVVKPDNFWQKQRTTIGAHKYKFEVSLDPYRSYAFLAFGYFIKTTICFQTTMISLEALPKVIDSSQLTPDLEGTLQYDHAQWIDLRLVSIVIHRKSKFFSYRNSLFNIVSNVIVLPILPTPFRMRHTCRTLRRW